MIKMRNSITQDELKKILHYNPDTGIFTWKVDRIFNRIKIGDKAGYIMRGYITIKIDYTAYQAHRLAWLYTHGRFPFEYIDHINHKKNDNRLLNLREATNKLNQENQIKAQKRTSSGYLGVSKVKEGVFVSRIVVNKKTIYLGRFKTALKAYNCYIKNKRLFHKGCTI